MLQPSTIPVMMVEATEEAVGDKMGEVIKVTVVETAAENGVVGVRMDEVDMLDMSHTLVVTQLMNGKALVPPSVPV
jgi:hypothetical protein